MQLKHLSLPRWLKRSYESLWQAFGGKPFSFKDAVNVLSDKNQLPENQVNVVLFELKRHGNLLVEAVPSDKRKKFTGLSHLMH